MSLVAGFGLLFLLPVSTLAASVALVSEQDSPHSATDLIQDPAAGDPVPVTNLLQEEYAEHVLIVDPADIQNAMINHHQFDILIGNETLCPDDVFLLVLVKTSPDRYMERQEVRNTWGSVHTHNGHTILPLFILGTAHNGDRTILNEIQKESDKYGDILQGDFKDNFRNETYKSIMGLTWAEKNCNYADFILVTNDDTMVDLFHLVDFLHIMSSAVTQEFLYCSKISDIGPERNPAEKHFVARYEYPYSKFPPHCDGFAYAMSSDVVSKLLLASESVPPLWMDDVYVTGMLPLKADITHTDLSPDHSYNFIQSEHLKHDIHSSVFLITNYKLRSNWNTAWKLILEHHGV